MDVIFLFFLSFLNFIIYYYKQCHKIIQFAFCFFQQALYLGAVYSIVLVLYAFYQLHNTSLYDIFIWLDPY